MNHDLKHMNIKDLVKKASRVIVPLSPTSQFAARSPWAELENETFESVSRWSSSHGVETLPSIEMFQQAYQRGEIDEAMVEHGVNQWLSQHPFEQDPDAAYHYCHQLIVHDYKPSTQADLNLDLNIDQRLINENEQRITDHTIPLSHDVLDNNGHPLSDTVNYHMMKWCKLFLDRARSSWTLPMREQGFYQAWRHLVVHDPALPKVQRQRLKSLPSQSETALLQSLSALAIPMSEVQSYLEGHLLELNGWAGMLRWQQEQTDVETPLLLDYLTIRISLEWAFLADVLPVSSPSRHIISEETIRMAINNWILTGGLTKDSWQQLSIYAQHRYLHFALQFDVQTRKIILLEAWEATYEAELQSQLLTEPIERDESNHVDAQLAFCIDVRSEQFRRQLEFAGPFETIGVAGFFGLPIQTSELGSHHAHDSLPVMKRPQHRIESYADEEKAAHYQQRKGVSGTLRYTFKKMKQNVMPSLLLPELSGPWLTMQTATRSFVPRKIGQLIEKVSSKWLHKPTTYLTLDYSHHDKEHHLPVGLTLDEQVYYVAQGLKLMGITDHFAPLVVLCGHGSQSTNNPYAASLDCGACGGQASGFNAKVLAQLCNKSEVREQLKVQEAIHIPDETVFAAAQHQTTTDTLEWLEVPELTERAKAAYEKINLVMPQVSTEVRRLRLGTSQEKQGKNEAFRRAYDWSEIRPEWGLARNASFIIGRRELTTNCNLEGRSFLHNYDWRQDSDGSLLNDIISGPATVAQWINLQYYASTVAPHYFGSGNKTTQTVTSGIGLMQGNGSDLMTGLPWQSVMQSDDTMYHSPIRLLVVVQAPTHYISRLLKSNSDFAQKVKHGWIKLASIDEVMDWHHW
ncbi:DUF2309 domain-containing protein [Staphylococcus auricularis]|uniref:Probable inorganic carbon transporter subunit DabA n=1 Tax=Staphylococcus auricularis TaxID=29379 RepID=A0ABX5IGH4_9STAP|nr:putative inorganic carbon transporter subunit DabA [Staphylococcus auricularis]MCE5037598.1 DUF2309 family protein [Staphylococcus auricularis]MEB6569880.1 Na-translocating system protein MpsB [Staphylococcus auricularis]PTH19248.1 DUF2309 domain-containing protein [Staphylococcus auricularis]PTH26209.1 DUF2309 domain-containing protein [Staphylococcus auricularis]